MKRLALAVGIVLFPCLVWADSFVLSGTVRHTYLDGSTSVTENLVLEGTMNISSTPTVLQSGPVGDNRILYSIQFNYSMGDRTNILGSGAMIVDDNGCGLFDCNMAGVGALNTSGYTYRWEVANGAFFDLNGNPYPSLFTSPQAYVVPPEHFELYGLSFFQTSGPSDVNGGRYSMSTALSANRVPEPSTLLLSGLGLAAFYRSRRAARRQR